MDLLEKAIQRNDADALFCKGEMYFSGSDGIEKQNVSMLLILARL